MELKTYGFEHFTDCVILEKLKKNFAINNTESWNEKLNDGSYYHIYSCGYDKNIIGVCTTFEEKIEKLRCFNGVYLIHFSKPKKGGYPFRFNDEDNLQSSFSCDRIALYQY